AKARRDPRESDPLPPAGIQPTSAVVSTFYNSVTRTMAVHSNDVFNDAVVLHEYGHFLEHNLSLFAPIAAKHDGCTAYDPVFGHLINSPEHAWMEGFAVYFARAVEATLAAPLGSAHVAGNPFTGGNPSTAKLETPGNCDAIGQTAGVLATGNTWSITPSMIETNVAALLWDLIDVPADGAFDTLSQQDLRIFQIFDRELGQLSQLPGINDFYCAWVGRGLSRVALDKLLLERSITRPTSCSDVITDRVVWRPSTGEWWVTGASQQRRQWGQAGDHPFVVFSDKDGYADPAVWRPSTATWWVSNSAGGVTVTQLGQFGDMPVPGDYDGDGRTDLAVWEPSNGNWLIPGTSLSQSWGQNGDVPVPADYDGDGKMDVAVWRPSTGIWLVRNSSTQGSATSQQWGQAGDIPVPADYDGDGRADFAVWRPSTGTWFVIKSSRRIPLSSPVTVTQQWGQPGDIPVPADYDHDGKADFAVWRQTGDWYTILSNRGTPTTTVFNWGLAGDVPLVPGPRY
ncbi:MAG: VCBS repeat-containing protein, partial [Gemmatimonadaceae bacterium]